MAARYVRSAQGSDDESPAGRPEGSTGRPPVSTWLLMNDRPCRARCLGARPRHGRLATRYRPRSALARGRRPATGLFLGQNDFRSPCPNSPTPYVATPDDLREPVGRPRSRAAVSQINSHELKCNSPSVRCHIAAPRRCAPDCRRLSIRNQSRGSAHTRWKIAAGNASGQHIDRICLSPIQAIRTFAKGQGESELRKSWSRGPVVQGNDCDHPCDDRDIRPFPPHGSERPT